MLKPPHLLAVQAPEVITIQDSPQLSDKAAIDDDDDDDDDIEIDIVGLSPPPTAPTGALPAIQQALKGGPSSLPDVALRAGDNKALFAQFQCKSICQCIEVNESGTCSVCKTHDCRSTTGLEGSQSGRYGLPRGGNGQGGPAGAAAHPAACSGGSHLSAPDPTSAPCQLSTSASWSACYRHAAGRIPSAYQLSGS